MDRTIDLDELSRRLTERSSDWSGRGFLVGPLTWRDADEAWPQPIVTDRAPLADPESLGVTLRLSEERGVFVVFWRGGWADLELSLDEQILLAVLQVGSADAGTALMEDLARRLLAAERTLEVGETMLLDADHAVRRSAGGRIGIDRFGTRDGDRSFVDHELPDPDDLRVALLDGWLLAVGDHSHTLLSWYAADPELHAWGPLARLDLAGYDPGGLDRVGFWRIDDTRCLVETEVGFGLAHRERGLVWEVVHQDLTCRVQSVTERLVITKSEHGVEARDVAEGQLRIPTGPEGDPEPV